MPSRGLESSKLIESTGSTRTDIPVGEGGSSPDIHESDKGGEPPSLLGVGKPVGDNRTRPPPGIPTDLLGVLAGPSFGTEVVWVGDCCGPPDEDHPCLGGWPEAEKVVHRGHQRTEQVEQGEQEQAQV